jgi:hypothetical protein
MLDVARRSSYPPRNSVTTPDRAPRRPGHHPSTLARA